MGDGDGKRDSYLIFSRHDLTITNYNMPTWSGSRLDNHNAIGAITLLGSNGYEYLWEEIVGDTVQVFFIPPGKRQKMLGPRLYKSESF